MAYSACQRDQQELLLLCQEGGMPPTQWVTYRQGMLLPLQTASGTHANPKSIPIAASNGAVTVLVLVNLQVHTIC